MNATWQRERDKVWRRLTKDVGIPVAPELKALINEQAGTVWSEDDLEFYEDSVKKRLELIKMDRASRHIPDSRKPKNPPKRRYQRSLGKRVHLVRFVIEHQITLKRSRGRVRKSIRWKEVCRAWNEASPNDRTEPEHLRRTFDRAVRDEDVQREFFRQLGVGIGQTKALDCLVSLVGSARLAFDWAILLGVNDIPLDEGFPSPEVERMIRNNPAYGRQAVNEWLAVEITRAMVKRHLDAWHGIYYAPVDFEEGGVKWQEEA